MHQHIPTTGWKGNNFLRKIWQRREHMRKAKEINNMGKELEGLEEGTKVKIYLDSYGETLKEVPNWKIPGHDGVYGYWFEKFISIHDRLAIEMNRCQEETDIPEWLTKGKNIRIHKEPPKGIATTNNCIPITCVPVMWKILTAQIRRNIWFANKPRTVPLGTENTRIIK